MLRGLFLLFVVLCSASYGQGCYKYFVAPVRKYSQAVESIKELRIVTYNMLNLYLHLGDIRKNDTIQMTQKPRWALEQMAETFARHPFDIMIAQEVESLGSARLFNKEFLNEEFNIYSTATKDKRGLYVVFFVRKTLPFKFQIESHLSEMWLDPMDQVVKEVFPRDLPTLQVYDPKYDQIPILTVMGAHLKSMRPRVISQGDGTYNTDKDSLIMREAQANRATRIIQRYQIKYGLSHPILIAGDFNNAHNFSPEFNGFFRHAKLSDSVSLVRENMFADKITHTYFGNGKAEHHQLDGILLTPVLVPFLKDSFVLPYYDNRGAPKDLPRTKAQRKTNASDHSPVIAIFDFFKLIQTLD